ncbi:hypothetical protein G9A89_001727 [Geosiphon pyriformis]|nr:hypothetical protein G9A89_001727 [Geosiphon pyriformis]
MNKTKGSQRMDPSTLENALPTSKSELETTSIMLQQDSNLSLTKNDSRKEQRLSSDFSLDRNFEHSCPQQQDHFCPQQQDHFCPQQQDHFYSTTKRSFFQYPPSKKISTKLASYNGDINQILTNEISNNSSSRNNENSKLNTEEQILISTHNNQAELARKSSHSAIERRRRERINQSILQLQQMIPCCANQPNLQKLTILQGTIDYINYLESLLSKKRKAEDNQVKDFDKWRYLEQRKFVAYEHPEDMTNSIISQSDIMNQKIEHSISHNYSSENSYTRDSFQSQVHLATNFSSIDDNQQSFTHGTIEMGNLLPSFCPNKLADSQIVKEPRILIRTTKVTASSFDKYEKKHSETKTKPIHRTNCLNSDLKIRNLMKIKNLLC